MIENKKNFFKSYSLFTLFWTLITIFWGTWVRLSLSGDGCGASWPLCRQKIFPEDSVSFIEWTHRLSSGLSLIFVFVLWLSALKIYHRNHIVRKLSMLSFALILIEALIGALLVMGGFVGLNLDKTRVGILAFHSVNSLFLTSALTLCWRVSLWEGLKVKKPMLFFVLFFPLIALTGNIASLAGQLFPTVSLWQALVLDFLPSAHISIQLRPLHPLLAVLFIITFSVWAFSAKAESSLFFKRWPKPQVTLVFILTVALFGFATLISLSPLWMKITHLMMAYALWIFLSLLSVEKV